MAVIGLEIVSSEAFAIVGSHLGWNTDESRSRAPTNRRLHSHRHGPHIPYKWTRPNITRLTGRSPAGRPRPVVVVLDLQQAPVAAARVREIVSAPARQSGGGRRRTGGVESRARAPLEESMGGARERPAGGPLTSHPL